ncbi:MAG: DUF58 domain-containing protein, partial [Bacteroidales bacterium]|nr:DUF58 domain-containing protein [Bacteroidales bacterium]
DIGGALRFLTGAIKKKSTVFLLSDMMDVDDAGEPRYEEALKVAVNRHDLSVIRVSDPREKEIPDIGLVNVKDAESGATAWVNTSSRKVRERYARWWADSREASAKMLNRYKVDSVEVAVNEDYAKALLGFFHKR